VNCHLTLPWGHATEGRYHTRPCCDAEFQTGLCQLGVNSSHKPRRAQRPIPPECPETGRKFRCI
jgi:hypothetical protein